MKRRCRVRNSRLFLFCFPVLFCVRVSAMQGEEEGKVDGSPGGCDCGVVLNLAVGRSATLMGCIIDDNTREIYPLVMAGGSDVINTPLHGELVCARASQEGATEEDDVDERHSETVAARALDAGLTCYPIHLAAIRGAVQATWALLNGGANPNQRGAHGRTPLHAAMAHGLFFVRPESYGSFTARQSEARRGACTVIRKQFSCSDLFARRASGSPAFGDEVRAVRFATPEKDRVDLKKVPAVVVRMRDWLLRPRSSSLKIGNRRGMIFSKQEEARQEVAYRIARLLVQVGARPGLVDDYAYTPLQLAALQHGQNSSIVKRFRSLLASDEVIATPARLLAESCSSSSVSSAPLSFSEGTRSSDNEEDSE